MSYNGSGTFLINSAGQPVVPGTTITTTAFNALTADLASGLTTAMTKDGQTVPTANIPMGGFKLTGLGAGTSATDAAQFGQLQNAPVATLITVSGADTITGTLVQTLTAYATGQQFSFVAAGTNTTAVTLNIDGLGAKAVTRTGAVALDAGALVSGQMAIVEYDGTRFQLINANAFTNLTVSGIATIANGSVAAPSLVFAGATTTGFYKGTGNAIDATLNGTQVLDINASSFDIKGGLGFSVPGTSTMAAINASGLVAMAGAATVGTTLGVTGTITPSSTNGIVGTTTNDSANAGSVGEIVSATLASGSAVSLTTATAKTVTSISLTAGDWDVTGVVNMFFGATTNVVAAYGGASTTNNTLGANNTFTGTLYATTGAVLGDTLQMRTTVPMQRISIASTTTVYLIAFCSFTVSTTSAHGEIRARRVR